MKLYDKHFSSMDVNQGNYGWLNELSPTGLYSVISVIPVMLLPAPPRGTLFLFCELDLPFVRLLLMLVLLLFTLSPELAL